MFFRNKLSKFVQEIKNIKPCDLEASIWFSTFLLTCNSMLLGLELFFFFLKNNKITTTTITIKQKPIGIIVASKIVVAPLFEVPLRLDEGIEKGVDKGVGKGVGEGIDGFLRKFQYKKL